MNFCQLLAHARELLHVGMGRDIISSFIIYFDNKCLHFAHRALCFSSDEGYREIILCGHTVLSIHRRRELDPASMVSHGMLDWAALPNELVNKIGDTLLSTDDIHYLAHLNNFPFVVVDFKP
jgi:hypothetical protein